MGGGILEGWHINFPKLIRFLQAFNNFKLDGGFALCTLRNLSSIRPEAMKVMVNFPFFITDHDNGLVAWQRRIWTIYRSSLPHFYHSSGHVLLHPPDFSVEKFIASGCQVSKLFFFLQQIQYMESTWSSVCGNWPKKVTALLDESGQITEIMVQMRNKIHVMSFIWCHKAGITSFSTGVSPVCSAHMYPGCR